MVHDYSYEVRIEDRDEDGNVTGSECEFTTRDKDSAISIAKELRNTYSNVVIEIYDQDDLIDVYMETEY